MSVLAQLSLARRQQILGILLIALGVLSGLSLLTMGGPRGALVASFGPDACGFAGSFLARLLAGLFGRIPALLVPVALVAWGANRVLLRPPTALLARSLAASALLFFIIGILGVSHARDSFWVGYLGEAIGVQATGWLGAVGAHVVLWAGLLVAVLSLLDLGLADVMGALGAAWAALRHKLTLWGNAFRTRAQAQPGANHVQGPEAGAPSLPSLERGAPPSLQSPAPAPPSGVASAASAAATNLKEALLDLRKSRRAERDRVAAAMASDLSPPRVARPEESVRHGVDAQAPVAPAGTGSRSTGVEQAGAVKEPAIAEAGSQANAARAGSERLAKSGASGLKTLNEAKARSSTDRAASSERGTALEPRLAPPEAASAGGVAARSASRPGAPAAGKPLPPSRPRGTAYALPQLSFLETKADAKTQIPEADILKSSRLLEQTLSHFDITGKVTEVVPGPVITRYAFEPAPGVKVNQILSRADDLALALRAHRLRLLAPIPGKAAVGIEVPNLHPETVHLGDVVGVELFKRPGGLLLALGKDVSGVPVVADLKKMPHLLIAGATGSGKSVCVNAIVLSLLSRLSPKDLRLVMVDPKMLELTSYNGIPHLLMPVVTEARTAAKALRFMVAEMQRRYQRLARRGVRDIESYNASLDQHAGLTPEVPPDEEHLPYIVVLIDELADLMLTLGNEIEDPIARLAQMARAVGIHLVLATQRPSVDVITGMIKANFPSRIAFQVASKVDSRTILDQNGAEALLGRGDMLYLPAGRPDPVRIHGAYVADREIQDLVRHWSDFDPPSPELDVERLPLKDGGGEGGDESDEDELFAEARRIVVQTGIGSTSLLQRRLKVGYARAGRLMDLLEQSGVVGPPDGSKAREVLIRPGDLPD